MKHALLTVALLFAALETARASSTYTITPNLTYPEFVTGPFSDQAVFSLVGTNPATITVYQIISYQAGGSGRGGGYKPGIVRHISLTSAAIYDANFNLVAYLQGTSTNLSGTFTLPAGIYYVDITGTGTGTKGAGEYGILASQIPPPQPPPDEIQ